MIDKLLLGMIRLYQLTLSPWLGRQCRFYPTCSHYATEAIQNHGAMQGMYLAGVRLCKCHPFHPGGVDLVPTNNGQNDNSAVVVASKVDAQNSDSCIHSINQGNLNVAS